MTKHIVLYEPASERRQVFSKFPMPRLGTILLGTILRGAGYDVSVYVDNVCPPSMEDLLAADLVGISTITVTAPRAYSVADTLRARGKPVVLGGPHVTFLADEALQHCDYVFRGEAEDAILPLVEAILTGGGLDAIPGLSYRRNGTVLHNAPAALIQDLNALPRPDFSLVRNRKHDPLPSFVVPIQTSRGCPYDCSFCSVTKMFGRKYRFRSCANIIEDLSDVLGHLSPLDLRRRRVFFYDDHLAADKQRFYELLDGILSKGLRFGWAAQVRADVAKDEKLLALMKRAGCRTLYIGIESINPETLKEYKKAQTVDEIRTHLRVIRRSGLRVYGMFVIGADADTAETIRATAAFAREAAINTAQFMILTPLPGTNFFQQLEEQDRFLHKDWSRYDAHNVTFRPARIGVEELQREATSAIMSFYSLPRILSDVLHLRGNDGLEKIYNRIIHARASRSWLSDR